MNIVVLSHKVPYPPNKGEKIRTFNQLEYLRSRGFNITVFCLLHERGDAKYASDYQKKTGIKVITAEVGLRKIRMLVGLLKFRALSVSNFYCGALQKILNNHIAKSEVDACYCTSSAMAEYVFKGEGQKYSSGSMEYLIDFMDLDSDKWKQYVAVNRFPMSWVYRYESSRLLKFEKKIQKMFSQCIFISENEVSLFKQKLSGNTENLKVIGNGVDLSQFKARSNMVFDHPPILLFSGVMDYFPNENAMCWFVDNVWPMLKSKYPDARLIIAGMNPSLKIKVLSEVEGITVTGYVDDMLEYYHQANIFVAPFQIARGVQNKILQSFACGLPVVTTAVGAEGIECADGQHLMLAETPEQFVEKIDALAQDSILYQRICSSALDLVHRNYSWDAKNEPLAELFTAGGIV